MFQDMKQNAILPFMQKLTTSLFFSLEQQLIINLIHRIKKNQYEIDQKSLEIIHRALIQLLKEDANDHTELDFFPFKELLQSLKLIPQNLIAEISKEKIPFDFSNTDNSTWKQIIFSGSQKAMNRKLFWQIEQSQMVTKSKLRCLIVSKSQNGIADYIKENYPQWEILYCNDLSDLKNYKEQEFHLSIINFFLSQNPDITIVREVKRITRDDLFVYDFIQYKDNPALYQSIRQLETLSLIKVNYHYEDVDLHGEKVVNAFLSKIIVNPKV